MRIRTHLLSALALLAQVSLAAAQAPAPQAAAQQTPAPPPAEPFQFAAEQRTAVYEMLTREHNAAPLAPSGPVTADGVPIREQPASQPPLPAATEPDPEIKVGAQAPSTVQLQTMPAELFPTQPGMHGYLYGVVNGEIMLVDPSTSKVVQIIRK